MPSPNLYLKQVSCRPTVTTEGVWDIVLEEDLTFCLAKFIRWISHFV